MDPTGAGGEMLRPTEDAKPLGSAEMLKVEQEPACPKQPL